MGSRYLRNTRPIRKSLSQKLNFKKRRTTTKSYSIRTRTAAAISARRSCRRARFSVPTLNLSAVPKNVDSAEAVEKHKPILEDVPARIITKNQRTNPENLNFAIPLVNASAAQDLANQNAGNTNFRVLNRTVSTSVLPRISFPIQQQHIHHHSNEMFQNLENNHQNHNIQNSQRLAQRLQPIPAVSHPQPTIYRQPSVQAFMPQAGFPTQPVLQPQPSQTQLNGINSGSSPIHGNHPGAVRRVVPEN